MAFDELTRLLGAERVLRDEASLAHGGRTTLPAAARPAAILRPSARDQVAAIVRIAARHRVPLHAVSTGKNWGWGDACPARAGQLVLDLGGLDRIVTVDEALGCAVIEPGVTQGALAQHLANAGSAWRLDCAGAGPDTSLVGNALERGLTFGTVGERWDAVCGLEAVLADGELVRTGFGATGGSRVARAHRYGVGPVLHGLFSQSSFGVVTELSLWLTPIPPREEIFWLACTDDALPALIDRLRPLRIRGVLPTNVHLFMLPIPGGGPVLWGANGALTGSPAAVAAHWAELEAAVADVATCGSSSMTPSFSALREHLGIPEFPFADALMATTEALVRSTPEPIPPAALLGMMGGPEVQRPVRAPETSDPRDADYGLIFCWQACAAVGHDVRQLVDLVRACMRARQIPPLMTIQFMTGRAVTLVTRITYDRKDPERRAAALDCQQAILEDALAAGFPPARTGLGEIERVANDTSFWQLVTRLGDALDPNHILSPGRHRPS